MFKVIDYDVRWSKRPGTTDVAPKCTVKSTVGTFSNLDDAHRFIMGKPKMAIVFSREAIKEMTNEKYS